MILVYLVYVQRDACRHNDNCSAEKEILNGPVRDESVMLDISSEVS